MVCTPHPHHHSGHDSHLWWGPECHCEDIPGACGGVLRSREVPLGLGGGQEEEYGLIGENWGCDGAEMGFGRSGWEGGEQE